MNRKDWPLYIDLIHREVVPALGCTEPTAVALASARAAEELGKEPESIDVYLSRNVLKNGLSVGIPGTGMYGLDTAAAVGALDGRSELELEVLKQISPEGLEKARKLLAGGRVQVRLKDCPDILYIEVILRSGSETSRVIIKERHANICVVEHNGRVVFKRIRKKRTPLKRNTRASG